jgi:hypothetical protein
MGGSEDAPFSRSTGPVFEAVVCNGTTQRKDQGEMQDRCSPSSQAGGRGSHQDITDLSVTSALRQDENHVVKTCCLEWLVRKLDPSRGSLLLSNEIYHLLLLKKEYAGDHVGPRGLGYLVGYAMRSRNQYMSHTRHLDNRDKRSVCMRVVLCGGTGDDSSG